jgi:hypothetical protein
MQLLEFLRLHHLVHGFRRRLGRRGDGASTP